MNQTSAFGVPLGKLIKPINLKGDEEFLLSPGLHLVS